MKLENQVTNLELSKKLKKLGVKQDSLFWWCYEYMFAHKKYPDKRCALAYSDELKVTISYKKNEHISAFTVAELGEMFPTNIQLPFKRPTMNSEKEWGEKWFWSGSGGRQPAENEADARAEMLIYLLENKIIKL
jgi:hypothetical protein